MRAVLVDTPHLAVLDVADIFRADDVERAGLRGEDWAAVEGAEHQRRMPSGVAGADQLLVGHADEGVGAFELAQASMKRSTKRLRLARATRCRITSVSVVDCIIAPSWTS